MSQGRDREVIKKAERILEKLIKETHSQHGFLVIMNQDSWFASDAYYGLTLSEEDKGQYESLLNKPFFKEKLYSRSPITFDITVDGPFQYFFKQGARHGLMMPLHDHRGGVLGTVFLCSGVSYSKDVVDFIHHKVSIFEDLFTDTRLQKTEKSNNPAESLKVRLKRYEQSAKALFDHNPDVIWWMDSTGTILSVNSRVSDVFGLQKDDFVNSPFDRFFTGKDSEKAISYFVLAKKGNPQNFEITFIHNEGYNVELNLTLVPVTVDYKIVGVYGIAKDITDRKLYEAALKESNLLITNILESITDGFIAVDSDFRITYWNKEAERLMGKKREFIIDRILWGFYPWFVGTSFTKLHKAMYEQVTVQYELKDNISDKWYWVHVYPRKNGLSIFFQDITGRKKAEQQIAYMTYYDTLTGLPNQLLFKERLNQILTHVDSDDSTHAVMVIGMDRFKAINDLVGRDNGDRLIIAVSKRLSTSLREDDTLCRYEGDKFAVLLRKVNRNKVERIAERILDAFQNPFILEHQEMVITPSIGIAFYPTDGNDSENLVANADTAMRKAKEIKNTYQFYSACMNTHSLLSMEWDLRKAIERNELMIFYQPQVDIRSGRISGLEALIRWKHPEWGIVSPEQFIPLAEETGLIIPIGEWALRRACAQNKAWQDAGFDPMVISVNVSQRQFTQGNLIEMVKNALEETGLSPQYLGLEITESMTLDLNCVLETLEELKGLGVNISMDDFGKGYSSLFNLKRLPIDTLKIDQSFIRDCTVDESDAMIVKTIISMAHSLNLNVIAEGVETREQLVFLQQNLCNEVQGYLFSKPLPALELEQQLSEIANRVKQYGISTKLTERMWLEEQLRAARQDLEDTVRKQQGTTFKFREQNGRFIHTLCDGELLYRLGLTPGQVIGKELHDFLPQDLADLVLQSYRKAWQGEPNVSYEIEYNGIWCLASLRPITRGCKVVEVIGNIIDITERKQMEEELRKSASLAAIGELAAGIAHEIRNPIASIKGFIQLMKSRQIKPEYFDIMFSEFKSLETKLDELLLLAKPQATKCGPIDLRALLQEVLMLMESQAILNNIQMFSELLNESLTISGDRNQLKQVFVNILKNAIEAMPGGGEILVQMKRVDSDHVCVTIIDQGCGMSEERLKRIGEPFFSNKEKGTGLGLTISHKIVKEHQGSIVFQSELNKGTIVKVTFPIIK